MRRRSDKPFIDLQELEPRTLFANPTLAVLPNVTLLSGAPLQIPLDGSDADVADALTFSATSTNANITPTISPSTNRSLKISVSHTSSGTSDAAFTGDMILKLFEDKAPNTTSKIIKLAQSGFYNNLIFHRVINNFVIQGGDPLGNGTGGSGTNIDDEFDPSLQFTGTAQLAMAKSYDDTDDSQFFITEGPQRHLDFNHTIFGQLIEGEAIRDKISNVPTDANGKPLGAVTMTAVTVIPDIQNGVLSLSVPNNITSGTATITVTAKDPANNQVQRTFTVTIAPDTQNDPPILGPVPDVVTRANTPTTVQLTATDVDTPGTTKFLNWVGLYNNFNGSQAVRLLPPDNLPPSAPDRDIDVVVDFNTGLTTITPKHSVAGVFPLYVGAAEDLSAFDSQIVPMFISPAAPTSIDLIDASDTGVSSSDNITRLNNASAATKLQFLVSGVIAGASVSVFDGNSVIGAATVPAGQTSVTVTTNGAFSLSNGQHNISAQQKLLNLAWTVGNRSGTSTLTSLNSTALPITVDNVAPTSTASPVFNWSGPVQNIVYAFSENVAPSLVPADVTINGVTAAQMAFAYNSGNNQATLTFPGFPNGLPDGNYTATLTGGNVTDIAGNPLTTSPSVSFFSLAGDANHNRTVEFSDLVTLAQNYNATGKGFAQGNFNYDAAGNVDFSDLVILAQRYNVTLAAPTPAPPVISEPQPGTAPVLASTAPQDRRSNKSLFSTAPVSQPTSPRKPARPRKT
jgi:cyclophilin family peptidyl-prolyl cis-trans isomerase